MTSNRLPTPIELHKVLTQILSEQCKCEGSWAQHPQAVTLEEFLKVQKAFAFYFKITAEGYVNAAKTRAADHD